MKKILCIMTVLLLAIGTTDAYSQGWLEELGKKAKKRAKEKVEEKINKKVDDTVDKALESAEEAMKKKEKQQKDSIQKKETGKTPLPKNAEMAYAKSDFVRGDVIIFEDLMDDEQLGEFPSMWDLKEGSAEVASINGKKAIFRSDKEEGTYTVAPLMKNPNNYLPEKYTIEMDLWMGVVKDRTAEGNESEYYSYRLFFYHEDGRDVATLEINNFGDPTIKWSYHSNSGAYTHGDAALSVDADGWHHLAISFNKRAFKVYLDGIRLANIPNMTQASNFAIQDQNINHISWASAITNVRIAEGAVPLYDRMMSDGKFITYGITFDVGKSTIKPESMGEISRIVQLMNENPDLKFSVEGHTDNTGNATSNQMLSEARSKAIVDKLVEMGIAADRLTSIGKGQTSPIADNSTDEGRAKNRRVEFVKKEEI
ncbi:OmpA family protein [Gabonibacter massiliensis]|uniref:OmpA family protein n=1 Tax=Gabonibacter massiliensis TaxID=1720195 RepID=UPI00073E777F|nr:OmpA family protein [Gabonibacter massiliensis]